MTNKQTLKEPKKYLAICLKMHPKYSFVPNYKRGNVGRGGGGVNYKFWGKKSEVHLIITKEWPKIKHPNFKKS